MVTKKETTEKDEQEVVEQPKQKFNFFSVDNEAARTYVYDDNRKLRIEKVNKLSYLPNGGHRVLTKLNPSVGFRAEAGWICIIYEAEQNQPYIFTE